MKLNDYCCRYKGNLGVLGGGQCNPTEPNTVLANKELVSQVQSRKGVIDSLS